MELYYICNGFLLALNVFTAFFFLSTTMKTKPYREALGWLGVIGALLVLSDIVLSLQLERDILMTMRLYTVKDYVVLPFYMLELSCLLEQEAENKKWRERWMLLLLSEIPFVLFVVLVLFVKEAFWVYLVAAVYACSFILYNMVKIARKIRMYEKAYREDTRNKGDNPFGWIKMVYSLHIALFVVYSVMDEVGFDDHLLYYTVFFSIILMLNTYYVNKQLPLKIDLTIENPVGENSSAVEGVAANEEMDEDLNKRRKRVDMQLYMDQFLLKNPQYERRLVGSTPNKLTRRDIYLCMLIADGCNIETLSRNLSIGTKSVEVARSRLRAKLNLTPDQSLKKFLQDLM